jgi:membrane associated rhomboid family serine protease
MRAPSRHDPTPRWMRPLTDRLSPTITVLVVINALTFVFYAFVSTMAGPTRQFIQNLVENHLVLGRAAFARGEVWQLVTALFVHLHPVAFFFDIIGLWWVGAALEREVGRARFLALFFLSAVLANAVMAGLFVVVGGLPYSGCGAGVLALFVGIGRLYNRTPVRMVGGLVMEARTLTLIVVAFALVLDLVQELPVHFAGHLTAVLVAYLLAGGRGGGLRLLWQRVRGGRTGGRRLHLVKGDKGDRKGSRYIN